MKEFFKYAMLMMGVCLFTACPSDDNDEEKSAILPSNNSQKVSSIKVYKGETLVQTIKFYYSGNRIASADYSSEEAITGPGGYRIFYDISGNTMTLSGCMSGQTVATITSPGKGTLNSMGLLEEEYYEYGEYDINRGKYGITQYTHNSKGQLTEWKTYYLYSKEYGANHTYQWENDCIGKVTGNPGGNRGNNFSLSYTHIENKANINFNWMIEDQIFDEDIYGLALCGYKSVKDKYLKEGVKWTIGQNGCVAQAESGGYTYVISY